MKRYLAFFGPLYYQGLGKKDFIGDYDTEKEALNAITKKINTEKRESKWASIYDSVTRKKTWSNRNRERIHKK